jgi:hypothetical protein
MKKHLLSIILSSVFIIAISQTGLAGGGHIASIPFVEETSSSEEGLKDLTVRGTVVSGEELKRMDIARRFIVSKHGDAAKTWPLMIDLQSTTATYLNKVTNKFVVIDIGIQK